MIPAHQRGSVCGLLSGLAHSVCGDTWTLRLSRPFSQEIVLDGVSCGASRVLGNIVGNLEEASTLKRLIPPVKDSGTENGKERLFLCSTGSIICNTSFLFPHRIVTLLASVWTVLENSGSTVLP